MNILVVLQSHSKGNSQNYMGGNYVRFASDDKAEIMRRCTLSLVESLNYAVTNLPEFTIELVVLDDHSDESAINDLKDNLSKANFNTKLIHLETHGIMPSILQCYEYGRDYGKDVVYFAQDDYMYCETAITDMVHTMYDTSYKLQKQTCIYPFDDPYRYIPENTVVQSHIIRCRGRHWRTQNAVASCFMMFHQTLKENWDLFDAMGKHPLEGKMEDNTINKLWYQRGYYLFVPIPSLALHMQYDTEMDDQIDWQSWWKKYDRN